MILKSKILFHNKIKNIIKGIAIGAISLSIFSVGNIAMNNNANAMSKAQATRDSESFMSSFDHSVINNDGNSGDNDNNDDYDPYNIPPALQKDGEEDDAMGSVVDYNQKLPKKILEQDETYAREGQKSGIKHIGSHKVHRKLSHKTVRSIKKKSYHKSHRKTKRSSYKRSRKTRRRSYHHVSKRRK